HGLCDLVLQHLSEWEQSEEIPQAFLQSFFEAYPPCKDRYDQQTQRLGFVQELQSVFTLLKASQHSDGRQRAATPDSLVGQVESRLVDIAHGYGIDLDQETPSTSTDSDRAHGELLNQMQHDLRDLFAVIRDQNAQHAAFSPTTFVDTVLD